METEVRLNGVLKELCTLIPSICDERQIRLLCGCMAKGYGHGGIKVVCDLTGLNKRTVSSGISELEEGGALKLTDGRVRNVGAGRKKAVALNPELLSQIETLLENNTFGNPENVIVWTDLSLRKISELLAERYSITVGKDVVSRALEELGYSKQVNQKMMQVGSQHPDRNAQFEYINQTSEDYINAGDPVISTDTKKKELVGNFKNNGAEYRKTGNPRSVLDHDFPIPELGKVAPYGVYVLNDNSGYINLGTDHDTGTFAVESIRRWWYCIGKPTFPNSRRLYINCDGGGSNGSRNKLWKLELAMLAEEIGMEIQVSHFPPGTSKWNKIEHKLFCYISKNWQGKPLVDIQTIVSLIGSTSTAKGLKVICNVDNNKYETGTKVSDDEIGSIDIQYVGPNQSWNYIIKGFKKCI